MQTEHATTVNPPVTLESVKRVWLDKGGYAPDGRYFGQGAPVWCVTLDDGEEHYVRAGDKDGAVQRWLYTQRYEKVQPATVMLYRGTPNDGRPHVYVNVPVKTSILPWQAKGLQQTRTGYGRKLTTTRKVFIDGTWKRVYCCIFSNSGTCYTLTAGKWAATIRD